MIKQWADKAIGQGIGLIASLLMRSAIKPLLRVDERSLLEVGLSHADLIECLSTPPHHGPDEIPDCPQQEAWTDQGVQPGRLPGGAAISTLNQNSSPKGIRP